MAKVYWRGQAAYLTWQENGVQRRKSLGKVSIEEASDHLADKEYELRKGVAVDPVTHLPAEVQLEDWVKEKYLPWHRRRHSPDSHYRINGICENHLFPYFKGRALASIENADVEEYIDSRLGDVVEATINKEVKVIKAVINRAIRWKVLPVGHQVTVEALQELNSKPIEFYLPQQLEAIYGADEEFAAVWKFMVNTGLRRGEALMARRSWVVGTDLQIISTRQQRTKSGRWRLVPLSPGALEALDQLGEDHILPRMRRESLTRRFKKAAVKAGVPGSIQWLRHTFCSTLVSQGVNLRVVQELAGHASMKTTERYAKAFPDAKAAAVKGLTL